VDVGVLFTDAGSGIDIVFGFARRVINDLRDTRSDAAGDLLGFRFNRLNAFGFDRSITGWNRASIHGFPALKMGCLHYEDGPIRGKNGYYIAKAAHLQYPPCLFGQTAVRKQQKLLLPVLHLYYFQPQSMG
jgi:hypothetical protein